jgi:hypothetical protein
MSKNLEIFASSIIKLSCISFLSFFYYQYKSKDLIKKELDNKERLSKYVNIVINRRDMSLIHIPSDIIENIDFILTILRIRIDFYIAGNLVPIYQEENRSNFINNFWLKLSEDQKKNHDIVFLIISITCINREGHITNFIKVILQFLQDDEVFIKKVIRDFPSAYPFLNHNMKRNIEIAIMSIRKYGDLMIDFRSRHIPYIRGILNFPIEFKDDLEFLRTIAETNIDTIQYLLEFIDNKRQIIIFLTCILSKEINFVYYLRHVDTGDIEFMSELFFLRKDALKWLNPRRVQEINEYNRRKTQ